MTISTNVLILNISCQSDKMRGKEAAMGGSRIFCCEKHDDNEEFEECTERSV